MVIYLRHDIHGTKVAISDTEATEDEANGWKRFKLSDYVTSPQVESIRDKWEKEELNQLRTRRGRKPKGIEI